MISYYWKQAIQLVTVVLLFGQYGYLIDVSMETYDDFYQSDMPTGYTSIISFLYNNWFACLIFICVVAVQIYLLIAGNYVRFR